MAGENLDLKIVIDTLLSAKGFEEAKEGLKGLVDAANKTAPATDDLTKKTSELGKTLGGSRGAAADLARVLLQNMGVMGATGPAAKAAGVGVAALAGSATALTVAVTGGIAAIALLLPKLISIWKAHRDAAEAARDYKAATEGTFKPLTDAATATAALKEATQKLKDEHIALTASIAQVIPDLEIYARLLRTAAESRGEAFGTERIKQFREETRELNILLAASADLVSGKTTSSAEARAILRQREDELAEAQLRGITVQELYAERTKKTEDADKAATKATQERKKAQEALNNALAEGRSAERSSERPDIQAALKKDSAAIAKAERDRNKDAKKAAQERVGFVAFETAREESERESVAEADRGMNAQALKDKRAQNAAMLAEGTASLTAFFGQNKAARIAQAIADTYAAATAAYAQAGGGPWGIPILIFTIAQGLAQVSQIRKTEPGFDDPVSDLVAAQFGRKWARDMIEHANRGFQEGLRGGGGASIQNTTINRGTTMNVTANGVIGSRTAFRSWLEREMTLAERVRARKTI